MPNLACRLWEVGVTVKLNTLPIIVNEAPRVKMHVSEIEIALGNSKKEERGSGFAYLIIEFVMIISILW